MTFVEQLQEMIAEGEMTMPQAICWLVNNSDGISIPKAHLLLASAN